MAFVWNNLAMLLIETGRSTEAKTWLTRAQLVWDRDYGNEHSTVVRGLLNLAIAERFARNHSGALMLLDRAVPLAKRVPGSNHPFVGNMLAEMALNLRKTNLNREARAIERRGIEIVLENRRANMLGYQTEASALSKVR